MVHPWRTDLQTVGANSVKSLPENARFRSLTPDKDRPAPSPNDSASRSWPPDIPRPPFDHVRALAGAQIFSFFTRAHCRDTGKMSGLRGKWPIKFDMAY